MSALPRVTDHCVIRYLERVHGLDIEAVRQGIAKTCANAVGAGATHVQAEGMKFALGPGVVITVMPTTCLNSRKVPRGRVREEAAE